MDAHILRLNRIRSEIAFIVGDRAIGGPDRSEELERLQAELKTAMGADNPRPPSRQ